MKYIFNALKGSINPLTKKSTFKPLDLNIHTLKKLAPDNKIIKKQNHKDFEDYIDGVFSQNPNLSEQEMYSIYHTHKPVFDAVKLDQLNAIKLNKTVVKMNDIKEKLLNTTDKELFGKLFDEHSKLVKKINTLYDKK